VVATGAFVAVGEAARVEAILRLARAGVAALAGSDRLRVLVQRRHALMLRRAPAVFVPTPVGAGVGGEAAARCCRG
jgi:hypothetical protein